MRLWREARWRLRLIRHLLPDFGPGRYGSSRWQRFVCTVGLWLGQRYCSLCGRNTWRIAFTAAPEDDGWNYCVLCWNHDSEFYAAQYTLTKEESDRVLEWFDQATPHPADEDWRLPS